MRAESSEVTIINFHGIGERARPLEPGEAPYWLSHDQFCIVLDRLIARPDHQQRFAITFDDSNISDLTIGVPELQRRGLRATFFVLTGRLGAQGSLDESGVKEIAANGMVIGSHGIDHRDLTRLSQDELDIELVRSRAELRAILGQPTTNFSIPFGRYDGRVLRAIRRAGYGAAYTSDGGRTHTDRFVRPRRSLRCDMSSFEIDRVFSGALPLASRLRRDVGLVTRQLI